MEIHEQGSHPDFNAEKAKGLIVGINLTTKGAARLTPTVIHCAGVVLDKQATVANLKFV
jgi:hypothetical protein